MTSEDIKHQLIIIMTVPPPLSSFVNGRGGGGTRVNWFHGAGAGAVMYPSAAVQSKTACHQMIVGTLQWRQAAETGAKDMDRMSPPPTLASPVSCHFPDNGGDGGALFKDGY